MSFNDNNIFGTPPEPYFDAPAYKLSDEALEDALYTLADENDADMINEDEKDGHFKSNHMAAFMFLLCKKWKQPQETRYIAVEIFDNFMTKHLSGLYLIVKDSSSKNKESDWKLVQNRVRQQLPLRMVSCVQIASKLVSHRRTVQPEKAEQFLNSIGQRHSVRSIVKSELRVLQTLNFKVMVKSPLSYIEILLEILVRSFPNLKVKALHNMALAILDGCYIQWRSIRHSIEEELFYSPKSKSPTSRHSFGKNAFLLAASVLVTAAHTIDVQGSKIILQNVSEIVQITEDDILTVSRTINRQVLNPRKHNLLNTMS